MISIKGLSAAKVLVALWEAGKPSWSSAHASEDDARSEIERGYVDYFEGVKIGMDFSSDEVDPRIYDRDHGQGATALIIEALRING